MRPSLLADNPIFCFPISELFVHKHVSFPPYLWLGTQFTGAVLVNHIKINKEYDSRTTYQAGHENIPNLALYYNLLNYHCWLKLNVAELSYSYNDVNYFEFNFIRMIPNPLVQIFGCFDRWKFEVVAHYKLHYKVTLFCVFIW